MLTLIILKGIKLSNLIFEISKIENVKINATTHPIDFLKTSSGT